jgi:hypothetical protein
MNAGATDLQKAVFAALAGDVALTAMIGVEKIYDHTPAKAEFPYITFGRASAFDWSTGTEPGSEHFFSLHVWSQARGRKQALAVMERVRIVLGQASLALDAHHLVLLRLEQAEVQFEPESAVHHGVMRFRALVE